MDKAYRKPKNKIQIHPRCRLPERQGWIEFHSAIAEMLASNGFAKNVQ
jgi:hypothetical protein